MAEGESQVEYSDIKAYVTKDGSLVRELMHPNVHGKSNVSVEETVVPAGETTLLHKDKQSEEIYHITNGSGTMEMAGREFTVHAGDTICINPATEHRLSNSGSEELKLIAVSSSPSQNKDTELIS